MSESSHALRPHTSPQSWAAESRLAARCLLGETAHEHPGGALHRGSSLAKRVQHHGTPPEGNCEACPTTLRTRCGLQEYGDDASQAVAIIYHAREVAARYAHRPDPAVARGTHAYRDLHAAPVQESHADCAIRLSGSSKMTADARPALGSEAARGRNTSGAPSAPSAAPISPRRQQDQRPQQRKPPPRP